MSLEEFRAEFDNIKDVDPLGLLLLRDKIREFSYDDIKEIQTKEDYIKNNLSMQEAFTFKLSDEERSESDRIKDKLAVTIESLIAEEKELISNRETEQKQLTTELEEKQKNLIKEYQELNIALNAVLQEKDILVASYYSKSYKILTEEIRLDFDKMSDIDVREITNIIKSYFYHKELDSSLETPVDKILSLSYIYSKCVELIQTKVNIAIPVFATALGVVSWNINVFDKLLATYTLLCMGYTSTIQYAKSKYNNDNEILKYLILLSNGYYKIQDNLLQRIEGKHTIQSEVPEVIISKSKLNELESDLEIAKSPKGPELRNLVEKYLSEELKAIDTYNEKVKSRFAADKENHRVAQQERLANEEKQLSIKYRELEIERDSAKSNLDLKQKDKEQLLNQVNESLSSILAKYDEINDITRTSSVIDSIKSNKEEYYDKYTLIGGVGIPVRNSTNILFEYKNNVIAEIVKNEDGEQTGIYKYGYEKISVPKSNLLFEYNTKQDKDIKTDYLSLLVSDILNSANPGQVNLNIIDPENLGLSMYSLSKVAKVIIDTKEVEDIPKQIIKNIQTATDKLGRKNISTYNDECRETGKTPLEWHLYVILSTGSTNYYTDNVFTNILDLSVDKGVLIYLLHPTMRYLTRMKTTSTAEKEADVNTAELENYLKRFTAFSVPRNKSKYCLDIVGNNATQDEVNNATKEYELASNSRTGEIYLYKDYLEKHNPYEKWFSGTTLDFVNFRLGALDGDRADNTPVLFRCDCSEVHALMAGTTGAGKSATLVQALLGLITEYHPSELQIFLIDFKNAEFGKFTGTMSIPHVQLVAGTTDGEYAYSLFTYLNSVMLERQKLFFNHKVVNIKGFNQGVSAGKIDHIKLPKIMVIIDEFQVMFNSVASRILDLIIRELKLSISLARAMGIHFMFCSQNMSGTLDSSILSNLAIKLALKLDQDRAIDFFGNAAPSRFKGKGNIAYRVDIGKDEKQNKLYKVPFADDDCVAEIIQKVREKYSKEIGTIPDARYYDEARKHNISETGEIYREPGIEKGYIFIGEHTTLNLSNKPFALRFIQETAGHMMITASVQKSLYSLVDTVMFGIQQYNYKTIIYNCTSSFVKVCGWDEEYNTITDMSSTAITEFISILDNIRVQRIEAQSTEPLFVFLNLPENDELLGVKEDYKTTEALNAILSQSIEANMFFIIPSFSPEKLAFISTNCGVRLLGKTTANISRKFLEDESASNLAEESDKISATFIISTRDGTFEKLKVYSTNINLAKIQKRTL